MAKIPKLHLFDITNITEDQHGTHETVGNNRVVIRGINHDGTRVIFCDLHGSTVVTVKWAPFTAEMVLQCSLAGYPTITTRQAIQDFLRAFGLSAGVSIANGMFAIRVNGIDYMTTQDETITITVEI